MSVMVRSATYGNVVGSKVKADKEELVFTLPDLPVLILVLVVLFSSLFLVYLKDFNRRLLVFSDQLSQNYTQLQASHDQLLLTRGVWSSQRHVKQVADQLGMQLPSAKEIVMIKI